MLTLTGPGGVGKTRLAIEAARKLQEEFRDGAAFVDVSPVRDPKMVLPLLATQLGVLDQSGVDLKAALLTALENRNMLVVLDNLEQVPGSAVEIAWLLDRCPCLTVLATSRVVLRITAENVLVLEPLSIPEALGKDQR